MDHINMKNTGTAVTWGGWGGEKEFVNRGLGFNQSDLLKILPKEPPVRKPKKIAPDNVGLLWYYFENKKGG